MMRIKTKLARLAGLVITGCGTKWLNGYIATPLRGYWLEGTMLPGSSTPFVGAVR